MAELPMRLHLLAPEVKCPTCGADLTFIWARGQGDLYQCTSTECKSQVMHYMNRETQACGYALVYRSGIFGAWTACSEGAAKGEWEGG